MSFALEESTYFQESSEKLVSVLEVCVIKEFVYHVVYPRNLPLIPMVSGVEGVTLPPVNGFVTDLGLDQ